MSKWRVVASSGIVLLVAATSLLAQETKSKPASAPEPIDPARIAFRVEELTLKLRDFKARQASEETLAETERKLKQQYADLQAKAKETRSALGADCTSLDLHEREDQWRTLSWSQTAVRENLTSWNRSALQSMQALDVEEATWKATLDTISKDLASDSLRQIVQRALTNIREARQTLQKEVNRIVSLQEEAVKQSVLVTQLNTEIADAEKNFHAQLLVPLAEPVWRRNPIVSGDARTLVSRSVSRNSEMLVEFARLRKVMVGASTVSFLLVLVFLYRFRRQRAGGPESSLLLMHPLAAALILQLPFALALAKNAPAGVLAILLLLSLVPIVKILTHDAPNRGRALHFLAAFYTMSAVLDIIPVDSPLRRIVFLLFATGSIALLILALRRRAFRNWSFAGRSKGLARLVVVIGLVLMLIALGASVLGYISLAQFLRQAILLTSYLALLLIAWVRVTTVLVSALVHSRFVTSPSLRNPAFETWFPRVLGLAATVIWFVASLNLLLLRGLFTELFDRTMAMHFPGRLSGITLGDVLIAVLVLLIGFIFARAFRFFLREDVLSRFRLDRGIPDLISNLMYYIVLVLVFVGSLKAIGLDLSKLTLLTGAFGVGLGFGMQNIVNNFVSGLILEFERPIHTGDVIETAGQMGEVVRIGIRSTAIRTSQDAEVIIPNASLISGNVVNWTSSAAMRDSKSRVAVPVLVRAGANPAKISEILVHTAALQPRVSEAFAYLKSSTPTSLLFELSFSIAPGASPNYLRNQVAIAAARAIREEDFATRKSPALTDAAS